MKTTLSVLLCVTALATSIPAHAQSEAQILYRSGNWYAYYTNTAERPNECGMANGTSGELLMYHDAGDEHLSIEVSSPTWLVTNGTSYNVKMVFDEGESWAGRGEGKHYTGGRPYLDISIRPLTTAADFLITFMAAQDVQVSFGSQVRPWLLSLTGTMDVTKAFLACMKARP